MTKRSLIKRKLEGNFYFRQADYQYLNSETQVSRFYYGAFLTYRINRSWMISLLGELAVGQNENNQRINTKLIKRIGKKR